MLRDQRQTVQELAERPGVVEAMMRQRIDSGLLRANALTHKEK